MAQSISGGLSKLHRALNALNTDVLDRDRKRFSQTPDAVKSLSGTTTRSPSPDSPGRAERNERFQQKLRRREERAASLPLEQFKAQREEEARRIFQSDPLMSWQNYDNISLVFHKEASNVVKKQWIEQGIWKESFENMAAGYYMGIGKWKHEEPLDNDGSEVKNREASRPFYQFIYQISRERSRIEHEMSRDESPPLLGKGKGKGKGIAPVSDSEEVTGSNNADINTRAYQIIKSTWVKHMIWNEDWGILPGMQWKHELPLPEDPNDTPLFAPPDFPQQVENIDEEENKPSSSSRPQESHPHLSSM